MYTHALIRANPRTRKRSQVHDELYNLGHTGFSYFVWSSYTWYTVTILDCIMHNGIVMTSLNASRCRYDEIKRARKNLKKISQAKSNSALDNHACKGSLIVEHFSVHLDIVVFSIFFLFFSFGRLVSLWILLLISEKYIPFPWINILYFILRCILKLTVIYNKIKFRRKKKDTFELYIRVESV